PSTVRSSLRPRAASTAATTAQSTATTTADQPRPMTAPSAHHSATERNSRTMWPATPAPASMPAPFPARCADCLASALASSTSCLMRVDRSRLASATRSPALCWSAGGPAGAAAAGAGATPGSGPPAVCRAVCSAANGSGVYDIGAPSRPVGAGPGRGGTERRRALALRRRRHVGVLREALVGEARERAGGSDVGRTARRGAGRARGRARTRRPGGARPPGDTGGAGARDAGAARDARPACGGSGGSARDGCRVGAPRAGHRRAAELLRDVPGVGGVLHAAHEPAHEEPRARGEEEERARPAPGEVLDLVEHRRRLAVLEPLRHLARRVPDAALDVRRVPRVLGAVGHLAQLVAEGTQPAREAVLLRAGLLAQLRPRLVDQA